MANIEQFIGYKELNQDERDELIKQILTANNPEQLGKVMSTFPQNTDTETSRQLREAVQEKLNRFYKPLK